MCVIYSLALFRAAYDSHVIGDSSDILTLAVSHALFSICDGQMAEPSS